jgi:hypothetical protein
MANGLGAALIELYCRPIPIGVRINLTPMAGHFYSWPHNSGKIVL